MNLVVLLGNMVASSSRHIVYLVIVFGNTVAVCNESGSYLGNMGASSNRHSNQSGNFFLEMWELIVINLVVLFGNMVATSN